MLVIGILSQLVVISLSPDRWNSVLLSRIGMISLIYSCILTYNTYYPEQLISGLGIYSGFYNVTNITHVMDIFVCILGMLILGITGFYSMKKTEIQNVNTKDNYLTIIETQSLEYPSIGSFVIVGIQLLIGSLHMISLYLGIELQSFSLYILSSLNAKTCKFGLKYFLLGALSSCFILLGIGLLYCNTGILSFDTFYIFYNNISDLSLQFSVDLALIILIAGLLFKLAVFPFQQWAVEIYDGVPTLITTWLTTLTKISILVVLMDIVTHCYGSWTSILILLSLLSILFGSLLGLAQLRLKRLLVYSMLSHVGFLVLSIAINSNMSLEAFIFYIIQYSITNLNLFFIILSMGYYFVGCCESPVVFIKSLKGFFNVNPFLAICFAISLLSMGGIPPLIGFFAKFNILHAAISKGYLFVTFIAIISSVISISYYLKVIKTIFFDVSELSFNDVKLSAYLITVIAMLTIFITLFIIYPNPLYSLAKLIIN
nr:NADH dehydrogenase subunit 2 [Pneumocystis sp. 'macacae']